VVSLGYVSAETMQSNSTTEDAEHTEERFWDHRRIDQVRSEAYVRNTNMTIPGTDGCESA
jgi:hypothetical protein